jgi:hypothetical protein
MNSHLMISRRIVTVQRVIQELREIRNKRRKRVLSESKMRHRLM